MPIYEYRCGSCGAREERLEPLGALEIHACETCGQAEGMVRQLSVAAVAVGGSQSEAPPCGRGGCAPGACPFA